MSSASHDEITIERTFDAPRSLVFANWTTAAHLGAWFAPDGFDVTECSIDARPGGAWRVAYASSKGERFVEHGELRVVDAPARLVLSLVNENGHGDVMFRSEVDVSFAETNGKTTMRFRQTGLASAALRSGVKDGWDTCFVKLAGQLTAEGDVRAIFDAWFAASERKDLDASMAPIAKDILSYEHETPLVYRGVDGLRATCKAGFDRAPDGLRWDVPDLDVIVRGDIAVTWGLNRMKGPGLEMWSRGTRVFQKIDGRWQMIHQHVSFPFDPQSGAAKTDLRP